MIPPATTPPLRRTKLGIRAFTAEVSIEKKNKVVFKIQQDDIVSATIGNQVNQRGQERFVKLQRRLITVSSLSMEE
jgi:hypothetical protein